MSMRPSSHEKTRKTMKTKPIQPRPTSQDLKDADQVLHEAFAAHFAGLVFIIICISGFGAAVLNLVITGGH